MPANEQNVLKSLNLSAMDGQYPRYVIATARDGKYHIYVHSSGQTYSSYFDLSSINSRLLTLSNESLQQAIQSITTTNISHQQYTVIMQDFQKDTYEDTTNSAILGNENVTINVGKGANEMMLNVSDGLTINGEDNPTKFDTNIFVTGALESDDFETSIRVGEFALGDSYNQVTNSARTSAVSRSQNIMNFHVGSGTTSNPVPVINYDPIIVDFNRDGKLSSMTRMGIDIDGDGKADGAAVDGDKMLAMSDLNGNGTIDGKEVFGNATISPFTKKPLNAANGFEALKMIAEEAKARGCDCIDKDGNVDLKKLSEELAKVRVKLGFVSDRNNTGIEDLAHVASINVNQYANHNIADDENIQIGQAGSYTDTDGNNWMASDFWYKLKK